MNSRNLRNAILLTLAGGMAVPMPTLANGPKPAEVEELNVDNDKNNVTDLVLTLDQNDIKAVGSEGWEVKDSIANRDRRYFLVSNSGKDHIAWASIGSDDTIKRTGSIEVEKKKLGGKEIYHGERELHGRTFHVVFDAKGDYAGTIAHDVFEERYSAKSENPMEQLFTEVESILENIAERGCRVNRKDRKKLEEAVRISTGRRFKYSGLEVVPAKKAKKVLTADEQERYSLPDSNKVCVVKTRQAH